MFSLFLFLVITFIVNNSALVEEQYYDLDTKCPVLYTNITIGKNTNSVSIKGGQKLFFGSKDAVTAYEVNPREYWLSPHDMPDLDHAAGYPDVRGSTFFCPCSGEKIVIDMQTPRVLHRNGQAVYFCCFGCVQRFWADPDTVILKN